MHNPEKVIYERLPRYRLSGVGLQEAQNSALYLAQVARLHTIYVSPLLRARMTADIIGWAQHPPTPVVQDERLHEVKTSWRGGSLPDLEAGKINFYEPKAADEDESITDIYARMLAATRDLVARHAGQEIAFVSHGDPTMILRRGLEGVELTRASIREPNYPMKGSVSRLVFHSPTAAPEISYYDPNLEYRQQLEAAGKAEPANTEGEQEAQEAEQQAAQA